MKTYTNLISFTLLVHKIDFWTNSNIIEKSMSHKNPDDKINSKPSLSREHWDNCQTSGLQSWRFKQVFKEITLE